jgi:hypothetical protein
MFTIESSTPTLKINLNLDTRYFYNEIDGEKKLKLERIQIKNVFFFNTGLFDHEVTHKSNQFFKTQNLVYDLYSSRECSRRW